jgi:hypothetical protein
MTGMRWTEDDLKRFEARLGRCADVATAAAESGKEVVASIGTLKPIWGLRCDPRMNKTEEAYAMLLAQDLGDGLIRAWKFEAMKLRLADRTWYTPDFMVIGIGGEIRFDETKGFWRDDARVKIKVAAEMFSQFTFRALTRIPKRKGGGWAVEEF